MGPLLLRPNYISPVWSGPRVNEARGLPGDTVEVTYTGVLSPDSDDLTAVVTALEKAE